MGGFLRSSRLVVGMGLAVSGALSLSSCSTGRDPLDLSTNEALYRPVGYEVQVPTDRPLALLPIADQRGTIPFEASDSAYPVQWMPDAAWARSMPVMVHEVLLRELQNSGLATSVRSVPAPAAEEVLLEIQLLDARSGWEEREYGRRAVASAAFRVVIKDSANGLGSRAILVDETIQQQYFSRVDPHPPLQPQSFGAALRGAVLKALQLLDVSNATRSGLEAPTELPNFDGSEDEPSNPFGSRGTDR
ncbi:MAG: hypothetical protein AAF196_09450 [Planctomycetota bacterium]